jgi:SulP family sulfate permease
VGAAAVAVLVLHPRLAARWLERRGAAAWARALVPRAGPLVVVLLGTLAAFAFGLSARHGLAVVGQIPAGLPRPGLPPLDLDALRALAPTVLAIALVAFLESYAVAQSLAARRRESVEGSQELVALGAANLGAAVTGGFPVTGGFSRSMVNFGAGARTGAAALVTAGLVALTLIGLTPLFFHLPRAVLAAVIVVAVLPLVDLRAARRVWSYSRADAAALAATFLGVFALGVEHGILLGVALSGVIYIARAGRPHVAVVGRVGDSEHFRNVERHAVSTDPTVLAVRIDENLYFGNVRHLEQRVHELVAAHPRLRHLVLIASGINHVDATGLECLERCAESLASAGLELHLAEVKGPVLDRLERAGFPERLGRERIHLSTHAALEALGDRSSTSRAARTTSPV